MKVKTSVLIEKRTWQQLKRISIEENTDTGTLIENAIAEKYLLGLDEALSSQLRTKHIELDFMPVKRRGNVSSLVRKMRDEREDGPS